MPPQYWLYRLAPLNHLYTLARISCWPPEDGSICDPKHVGVNFTWTFNVFLINIELWVHELVIIEIHSITVCKCSCFPAFYHRVPTVQKRLYLTSTTLPNVVCLHLCNERCYWLFIFRCVHSREKSVFGSSRTSFGLSVSALISASATGWISMMFGIGDLMKIS